MATVSTPQDSHSDGGDHSVGAVVVSAGGVAETARATTVDPGSMLEADVSGDPTGPVHPDTAKTNIAATTTATLADPGDPHLFTGTPCRSVSR
jgi:hypothetical protein